MFHTLLRKPQSLSSRRRPHCGKSSCKLNLEALEERTLLAGSGLMVRDIFPGPQPNNSDPNQLVNVNGALYFAANDGNAADKHGVELWKSDGTEAGTRLAADVDNGPASSLPGNLTEVNGKLYFTVNRVHEPPSIDRGQLYVDVPSANSPSDPYNKIMNYNGELRQIAGANGLTLFNISDSINFTSLWRTDGAPALSDGSPALGHTFKLMTFGGASELTGTN